MYASPLAFLAWRRNSQQYCSYLFAPIVTNRRSSSQDILVEHSYKTSTPYTILSTLYYCLLEASPCYRISSRNVSSDKLLSPVMVAWKFSTKLVNFTLTDYISLC
jgi:hypothetical protein